jgi:hypothetical protein
MTRRGDAVLGPVRPAAVRLADTGREPERVELPGREGDPRVLEHADAAVCEGHRVDRRHDERQQESSGHVLTAESALDILANAHGRDQMRAAPPGLRPRRLDVGVLEVPGYP